jgi:hypothetical protein
MSFTDVVGMCESCGTTSLPGGSTACSYGYNCMVCEDCMCHWCDIGQNCERHCPCNTCELCGRKCYDTIKFCSRCTGEYCPRHYKTHSCY